MKNCENCKSGLICFKCGTICMPCFDEQKEEIINEVLKVVEQLKEELNDLKEGERN